MTYRLTVTGPLAQEVTIPDCAREPRPGQRCIVSMGEGVLDLGLIVAVEEVGP